MMARRAAPPGGRSDGQGTPRHVPVLLREVMAALEPQDGNVIVDGTFGAGGYSRAILDAADVQVVAIDRDPDAASRAQELAAVYSDRLVFVGGAFAELDLIAAAAGHPKVDGVVLDIGVSSMQLDQAERGFSFQQDGPLDMRMSKRGPSAADVVNSASEAELADILFHLGEERRARPLARAIVADRDAIPFATTSQLAELVARVVGRRKGDDKHPATRTFQALRIYVNDELGQLAMALQAAERCLKPGGRLVVVTFHSLEDRIAKQFLAERAGRTPRGSRHLPAAEDDTGRPASFHFVNHRAVSAGEEEVKVNPRARSARLRWAVRTDSPAWPDRIDLGGLPRLAHDAGLERQE